MVLAYTKVMVELREISLRDRPPELYQASSKGTVPVLITTENIVIDESLDIMLWALKNDKNQILLSKEPLEELEMIKINDTIFKKWLDQYKYHDRYPQNTKQFYRIKCEEFLNKYESHLNKNNYLINNKMTIADIAIFPFIRQFANVDYKWFESNFKNLKLWLENFSNSDLFKSIMNKYPIWNLDEGIHLTDFS